MTTEVSRRNFLGAASSVAAGAAAGAALVASSVAADEAAPAKPRKILGICCSPRKGKTTAAALRVCLDAAKAVDPADRGRADRAGRPEDSRPRWRPGSPLEPGERDDFPPLAAKLADPAVAGIIFATPVYFGNMSSLCKAFLDRCIVFHKNKALANKVGGVLAVGGGRNCGLELTVRSVQVVADVAADDRRRRCPAHRPLGRNRLGAATRAVKAGPTPGHHPRRAGHGHGQESRPPRRRDGPPPGQCQE